MKARWSVEGQSECWFTGAGESTKLYMKRQGVTGRKEKRKREREAMGEKRTPPKTPEGKRMRRERSFRDQTSVRCEECRRLVTTTQFARWWGRARVTQVVFLY